MPSLPWELLSQYFPPDEGKGEIIYRWPANWPQKIYIWKAVNCETQETAIFKGVHLDLIDNPNEEEKEQKILIGIGKLCPNLMDVYEVMYEQTWMLYKLEYCEGGTLHDHLYHSKRRKSLSIKRCLEIMEQILNGLSYLHNHTERFVHRDLKPGNIFFCKDGVPKIGDYGLVKSTKWERFVSTAGTNGYKAPDKQYDKRSDIYSVGIILWEMVIGLPPFVTEAQGGSISNSELRRIISKSVDKQNKRYQSAEEFLSAIKEIKL